MSLSIIGSAEGELEGLNHLKKTNRPSAEEQHADRQIDRREDRNWDARILPVIHMMQFQHLQTRSQRTKLTTRHAPYPFQLASSSCSFSLAFSLPKSIWPF